MATPENIHVKAGKTLTLHGTRLSGGDNKPVICLHGLTRNARDFDDVAPLAAATGRDVVAFSMRGRGKSDYDPDYLNYHPLTYRDDVLGTMDTLEISEAVLIGTSLGGIVAMLVNEAAPGRVAGAVINDVGPELAPEGLARIASYVGKTAARFDSLDAAAAQIRAVNEVAFPGETDEFWRTFARRTFRENPDGSWSLDYDPAIGKALAEVGPMPDLWGPWASLKDTPTLVIRGALSDLLSPEIVGKMRAAHPGFDYAEVPDVGHAPMLTEPAAWDAIKAFLSKLD